MIFTAPKNKVEELAFGLEQRGTSNLPTRFTMSPEYKLSTGYAEIARQMGQKRSDGSEIRDTTRRSVFSHSNTDNQSVHSPPPWII